MTTVNAYITFNGNCEEAFNFYKSVFGGDFTYMGRFGVWSALSVFRFIVSILSLSILLAKRRIRQLLSNEHNQLCRQYAIKWHIHDVRSV